MDKLSYLSPKTIVKKSLIHGLGLFASKPIRKGEIVAIKGGYIYGPKIHDKIEAKFGPVDIQIADDFFIGPTKKSEVRSAMIFSNHSCNPKIGVKGQITFVAMRNIKAKEELTHDWAMTDSEEYRMRCNCGAPNCRKIITGNDWKKKDLQTKYHGYFSSYLAAKTK